MRTEYRMLVENRRKEAIFRQRLRKEENIKADLKRNRV
jgi:hypothetical protein